MKLDLSLLMLICVVFANAQVTSIPDQNFEQALLDQNIDSDGILNGQVLTSDINTLVDLNLGLNVGIYPITDATGLQDFVQLKNLTIDFIDLSNNTNLTFDLTANTMLESLTMNGGDDAITHFIDHINLSQNPNINEIVTPGIWPLRQLNLQSGTTDVSNLTINISIAPNELQSSSNDTTNNDLFCIKVTDEAAAIAGTGVYSTWTIQADSNPYYFSETCLLNTNSFETKAIKVYPNPVSNTLNIKDNNFKINSIKIFNLQGQLIKVENTLNTNSIDVSELPKGLHIIQIESDSGHVNKKFVKQ